MNDNVSTNNTSYGLYSLAGALIVVAILSFVGFFLFLTRMDMSLKINAVEQCGKISMSEQKIDEKSTVRYPLVDIYTKCLNTVGVK